ncbi:unannotated protein [freshwater metagenome]|uniref:Unannotated protein n=1 Tax=freshwater metagenome TaxID=449393 RepID=A0A6J5YGM5_9ZZZZ
MICTGASAVAVEESPAGLVASGPVPPKYTTFVSRGAAGTVDGACVVMTKVVGPLAPSAQPAGIVLRSVDVKLHASEWEPGS